MASNLVPDSQAVPSNIVCICGATFKSRKRLGTVQCSTCNMWSHLACYNLSKEEADKESFVFICNSCSACSPIPKCLCSDGSSCESCIGHSPQSLAVSYSELKECVSLLSARLEKIEDNHTKEVKSLKLHLLNLEEKNDQLQMVVNKLKDRPPVRPFRPVPKFSSGNLASHSSSSRSNQPRESLPFRPTDRPPCPFRIVWGTPSACSSAVVKHALTPLLPPDQLIKVEVKRSSRSKLSADGRGVKRKWWFTILAPEVTLSIIDTNWHLLSARSSWSLQHSLQSSGHLPAFKSPVQKHVNKGSGSVVSSGDLQGSVQVDKDRVSNVSAVRHQGSVQGNIGPSVFTTSQQDSDHVSLPMDGLLPVSSGFPEASTGSFSDFYISSRSYSANGTSPDSLLQSSASCSSSNIVLASPSGSSFLESTLPSLEAPPVTEDLPGRR